MSHYTRRMLVQTWVREENDETIDMDGSDLFGRADGCSLARPRAESSLDEVAGDP